MRRKLQVWGSIAAIALCAMSIPQARSVDSLYTDSVFAPGSFWYKPIPANVPLHPNSRAFVDEFLRQKSAYYGTVTINVHSYASPVYIVGPDVAPVRMAQWNCQRKASLDPDLAAQWAAVPIPPYALPSAGTDGEMTIYQLSTDTIWEFWQARKSNGQWEACWGGRMQRVSQSDGIWPGFYGVTATGLPFIGGQITAEELRRGEIRHVIGISLVDLEAAATFSWPARRSDGMNPTRSPNRIAEGQRFRLDPTVDVDALPMHPMGKVIARAAQRYGFVVWDHAGAIGLRAQNALSYVASGAANPYQALFGSTPLYAILAGFPWERLQFLPMNYGKP